MHFDSSTTLKHLVCERTTDDIKTYYKGENLELKQGLGT